MSYFTQVIGLTLQNFLSAAVGIAIVAAFVRGITRQATQSLGNFWVDIYRSILYILMPLSMIFALILVSQGVIQNFSEHKEASLRETVHYQQQKVDANNQPITDTKGQTILENMQVSTQTIPMGPVASQEAIKMLGTNGGGFFNANSAHPFENPTMLSNILQMFAIFLIPAALCFSFGQWVGQARQGWILLVVMSTLFLIATIGIIWFEQQGNPNFQSLTNTWTSGNWEGKESRFGITSSSIFAAITTAASCGAVNTMHDSLMPMSGGIAMLLMQLGEVVFGGVGSGLYGMLLFAILAVFIAGLMVGRTPVYLGKKIDIVDMKFLSMAMLITPTLVLIGTAISVVIDSGISGISNPGPHGFSQILYAFTSAANNNGSAFAGLSANTPYYNVMLAIAMWFGRYVPIIAVLAIAGSFASKKRLETTSGSMPTDSYLFAWLLIGIILIVGALTYLPALVLGPVIEHLQLF